MIIHDLITVGMLPADDSPLLACRNTMEWTNGAMNTLLAILREIPSFRSGGDFFQQNVHDRSGYEHLLDLIQSSLQEIITRYFF